jgi:hypothetical protein
MNSADTHFGGIVLTKFPQVVSYFAGTWCRSSLMVWCDLTARDDESLSEPQGKRVLEGPDASA